MAERVTMLDIARAAGVSASTVSRALNNHPTIPESTRLQIQQIAANLNYRIDARARNFRLQRSGTIATLFPYQGTSRRQISDPFYLEIVGAITDELDRNGYDTIIARVSLDSDDWPARYVLERGVDGILMIDRAVDRRGIDRLQALDARFVIWGASVADQDFISVGCDSVSGAATAVRHLASLGRRNIAFIGGFEGMVETDFRRQGYLDGLREVGLADDPRLMAFTDFTPKAASGAVRDLLSFRPDIDAIFACSDFMAMAVMETLRQMGRAVPDEISVVGYDDIALASYCSPRLTTIHQPIQKGGRLMARRLLDLIDEQDVQSLTLTHSLVIRDSCGAAAY